MLELKQAIAEAEADGEDIDSIDALWISPNNQVYALRSYDEHVDPMRDHLHRYCIDWCQSQTGRIRHDDYIHKAFDMGWVRMRKYGAWAKTKNLDNPHGDHRWDIHGKNLRSTRKGKVKAIVRRLTDYGILTLSDKVYLLSEADSYFGWSGDYDGDCVLVADLAE